MFVMRPRPMYIIRLRLGRASVIKRMQAAEGSGRYGAASFCLEMHETPTNVPASFICVHPSLTNQWRPARDLQTHRLLSRVGRSAGTGF